MSQRAAPLYGAIEAGGTKFACAVARGMDDLVATTRIATAGPHETFDAVIRFFEDQERQLGPVMSFGIASFGPLDLDPRSAGFGQMLATPKSGWSHIDLRGALRPRFAQPVGIDTDVNAAALAESLHDSNRQLRSLVYVTVGTGIGDGAVINGTPLQGLWHPEMGHIAVRRHPQDQSFAGVCPFHRDCLEGLANGPAIVARWGQPMSALLGNPLACEVIGSYLGQLARSLVLLLAPERIVFGGGVIAEGALLPYIRSSLQEQLAGYVAPLSRQQTLAQFIVTPAWGERSGIDGAIVLAMRIAATHHAARQ